MRLRFDKMAQIAESWLVKRDLALYCSVRIDNLLVDENDPIEIFSILPAHTLQTLI